MNHVKITYFEQSKHYRKSVPKALKDRLWDIVFGPEAGQGGCYVCGAIINSKRFEAGHVIAVHNNGSTTLENLKCICSTCNKSMGTQNLEEFKKTYFPAILNTAILKNKKECACGCHSTHQVSPESDDATSRFNSSFIKHQTVPLLPYDDIAMKQSINSKSTSGEIVMDNDEYEDYLRKQLDEKLKIFEDRKSVV